MRILIYNGTIITGDGRTVMPNSSITIEEGIITEISSSGYPYYFRADKHIDAGGGYIIPGIINHHAHGVIPGPFSPFAEAPLTTRHVLHNLDRHLMQGTTTVCNVCGFNTIEEIELINKLHPINVKIATLHTPLSHELVKVYGSALDDRHMSVTAEQMKEYGAVAIGEALTVRNIHKVRRELGIKFSARDNLLGLVKAIRQNEGNEARCLKEVEELLEKANLEVKPSAEKVISVIRANVIELDKLRERCFREQIDTAKRLKLPIVVHHRDETASLLLAVAPDMGAQMIAAHSNLVDGEIENRTTVNRELRRHGVIIDITSGDAFGAKQTVLKPDVTFSLIAEGLVDIISTDYMRGYWDSILLVLEKAVEQKVIDLPGAVAMATGNVVKALPRIAHNRGFLEVGRVADVVILSKDRISEVRTVIVGGRVIVEDGKRTYGVPLPA